MFINRFKLNSILKYLYLKYHYILFSLFYPKKMELYPLGISNIFIFIIFQKILNINQCRHIPWPVHFTSHVSGNIKVGNLTIPGFSAHCYIQGANKIIFGDDVLIGPGVKIISANHDFNNFSLHKPGKSIVIGNHVWIGANAIILPEVKIGNNSIIGAGSVVTHDVDDNCIVAGNPAKFIRKIE